VFLVRGRFNNRYYAMKLMNKKFIVDNERESIVENERFIMEAARHPFLVELFYAFETENYFAFIMECNVAVM
jgi:serum/glucocorticoid-regulated kinase 2